MKRRCAWCSREMPPKEGPADLVSHGVCERCADEIFSNTPIPLQRHLDKLTEPVIVVDGDVTLSYLNQSAQRLTGKTPDAAQNRKGGEVFDCAHSRLPGGCGRTIHCSGCAIRQSVTRTYETGEPQVLVPATLKKADPDGPGAAVLTITTLKRGDMVLLRIDHLERP